MKLFRSEGGRADTLLMIAGYGLLALLAVTPILATDVPPLVDYPNHMARMYILATQGSGRIVQDNYVVEWRPIPNLAMDMIVPSVARLLPVLDAGRLFLVLCFAVLVGGICALHRVVHGQFGFSPAVSFLVLYNLSFGWGFLNFYFSIGLCLLLFAGWIATRGWGALPRLLVFNVAAAILYLSHLFGFAVYLLAVGIYEVRATTESGDLRIGSLARRFGPALGQFGISAGLFASNWLFWDSGIELIELGSWYGNVITKLTALFSAFLLYGGWPDVLALGFVAIVVLASLPAGWLSTAPALRWHLVVFLLLTLASPHVFRGIFLDARVGFVLGCFLIAAFRITIPNRMMVRLLFAAMLTVFATKQAATYRIWDEYDRDYDEFRLALNAVESGSRILSAHDVPGASPMLSYDVKWYMTMFGLQPKLAYRGLINLSVIERGAFVPSVFTLPSAQPIRSAPRNRKIDPIQPARRITTDILIAGASATRGAALAARALEHHEVPFAVGWPAHFDYVVIFRYELLDRVNPTPDILESVASGSYFDIYKVQKRATVPDRDRAGER